MITVAVLTAVNPQTEAEEKIYLTSGKHFVFQNQHCLPLISGTFRTSTQIVNNSLTSTEVEFGFGSLSVINVSGVLDKYSTWAFDGREVRLYRVENENLHIPDDEPPTLVGKMGVPQFGTDAVEIPIFNLALVLDTPVIESYANGNVANSQTHWKGDPSTHQEPLPRVYGKVSNIKPLLMNGFLNLYGCNFDREGNPLPIHRVLGVYVRGGWVRPQGSFNTVEDLMAASVSAGHYSVCYSAGMIRLGTNPTGDVTMDVLEVQESDCTPAKICRRILSPFTTSGEIQFDSAQLDLLDDPTLPVGCYITDNETWLQVVNHLVKSYGGYAYPNNQGKFQFGRLLTRPVSTQLRITPDLFLRNSLKKLPNLTTTGVPSKGLTLQYNRYWHLLGNGAALPSLDRQRQTRLEREWDISRTAGVTRTERIHKLSERETVDTLINLQPLFSFQDLWFYGGTQLNIWTRSSANYSSHGITLAAGGAISQTINLLRSTSVRMMVKVWLAPTNTGTASATLSIGGVSQAWDPAIGYVEVRVEGSYTSLTLLVSGTHCHIRRIEIWDPEGRSSLFRETARRFRMVQYPQHVYELALPLDIASSLNCGDGIILESPRYGLSAGIPLTIIEKEDDWETEETTLRVWGGSSF